MNWYNLAFKNIKKSVRDYMVYFLTLILGVAIFYVFNSVGDQSVVKTLSETSYESIQLLLVLLEMLSVGVAFVLGFLIVYANQFLISRRKKEFGIYFLLGMDKRDVSKVLFTETALVGLISLVTGIVIGVFASQFMSILVTKFFDADLSAYVFTVSIGAVIKTIINFAIIYLVVLLLHSINISRVKLIDLLHAEKKAEKQIVEKPALSVIVFLVSAVVLGFAYYFVGFRSDELTRNGLIACILAGIVTNLVMFRFAAGFLLGMLQKMKGVYFRELNSFVIRQFCRSINSSAISMGIICLMIFAMICTFSGGISVAYRLQQNVREMTPVDFSIMYTADETVTECFEREGVPVKTWTNDYIEIPFYNCESVTWATALGSVIDAAKEQFPAARWNTPETILSVSDYNCLATMYGKETFELKEDEYLVVCNFLLLQELRDRNLAQGGTQQVGNTVLKPALPKCEEGYLMMSGTSSNAGILILPDAVIEKEQGVIYRAGSVMSGNYSVKGREEIKEINDRLWDAVSTYTVYNYMNENPIPPMFFETGMDIRESNNGLTMIVAFLVIYVGVVFLIASAAMLALKALSEAIDSTGKYEILKKIGCENHMLKRALFGQVGAYFGLPLLGAMIHSVFGLLYVNRVINSVTRQNIGWGIAATVIVLVILYGAYFIATYSTSKRIVGLEREIK